MTFISSFTKRFARVFAAISTTALLATGCVAGDASSVGEPELGASAGTEYLYGLTEAELMQIYPLAADRYDEAEWLEANLAPFDCARYGDMCRDVGPDAAYGITEQSYRLALGGATIDEVNAFLSDELDAAAVAWRAQQAESDERVSNLAFGYGGSNQERVRLEVFANKPALGDWHGKTECTYQVLTFGTWGGTLSADMTARVQGHLDPGQIDQNPASGGWRYTSAYDHNISTVKIYFYPPNNTYDLHIFGECDASKGTWSASTSDNVTN